MPAPLRSLCVFCGSSIGNRPEYAATASELGRLLADRGIRLVYGGGNVGLMGVLADAALDGGGQVVGVIPEHLMAKELGHGQVSELRVVGSMHERKALMADLSDAFVALPGGVGTLEELFEVYTWNQLGLHAKPLGLFNVRGYFDGLARFLDHAVAERFVTAQHRAMLLVEEQLDPLLDGLAAWGAPSQPKWIDRTEA